MLFRERPFQGREVQRRRQYCARRASDCRNYKEWKQTRMRVAGPANHEVLRAHQQGKKSPSCERVAISYGDIANSNVRGLKRHIQRFKTAFSHFRLCYTKNTKTRWQCTGRGPFSRLRLASIRRKAGHRRTRKIGGYL